MAKKYKKVKKDDKDFIEQTNDIEIITTYSLEDLENQRDLYQENVDKYTTLVSEVEDLIKMLQ